MKKFTYSSVATAALLATFGAPITNLITNLPTQTTTVKAAAESRISVATQQAFITKLSPYVIAQANAYGVYPSVMMAQAILESAYGTSTLASESNNLFGIKFNVGEDEKNYGKKYYWTKELIDGVYVDRFLPFRVYKDLGGSVADNGQKLRYGVTWNASYYSGAWLENAATYQAATAALQGKYATDAKYADKLNAKIQADNLTRFDPQYTKLNRNLIATKNATVYNTFSGVGKKVGTISVGKSYPVNRLVKMANGIKFYELGSNRWVKTDSLIASIPKFDTIKENGIVKVTYEPSAISVLSWPNGMPTGEYLKQNTSWKYTGKSTFNGALYYQVGNYQWVPARYVTVQNKPDTSVETPATGVIMVNYVPGYGVRLFDGQGNIQTQLLKHGTHFKVSAKKVINGKEYYKLGNDKQWIPSQYAKFVTDWQTPEKPDITPNPETKVNGVLKVKYVKNYSVRLLDQNGKGTQQLVKDGTNWKFFAKRTINGNVYYRIGNQNQWILAKYVTIE